MKPKQKRVYKNKSLKVTKYTNKKGISKCITTLLKVFKRKKRK
jgi:hypothetical protein